MKFGKEKDRQITSQYWLTYGRTGRSDLNFGRGLWVFLFANPAIYSYGGKVTIREAAALLR
jgi:hypothetical protein